MRTTAFFLVPALLMTLQSIAQQRPAQPSPAQPRPAQTPSGPTPKDPPPDAPGRVEGRIISPDGVPVAGATVRIVRNASNSRNASARISQTSTYTARTASDGTFSIEHVVPGTYTPSVQHPDYLAATDATAFSVWPAEARRDLVIHVPMAPVLAGVVTDPDGRPVPGALMGVLQLNVPSRVPSNVAVISALGLLPSLPSGVLSRAPVNSGSVFTADATGHFRISLQPGRYMFSAADPASEHLSLEELHQPHGLRTFFPASLHSDGAKVFDLASGVADGLEVRLLRGRTFSIRGTVSAPLGAGGFTVALIDPGKDFIPTANPLADGAFEFSNVTPGRYSLFAGNNSALTGRTEVVVQDADVTDARIEATPPATVSGRLSADGAPDFRSFLVGLMATRGVSISTSNGVSTVRAPQLTMMLTPAEDLPLSTSQVPIQPDGTFALSVAPAKYRLTLNNVPDLGVKSVLLSGVEVTGDSLDLTAPNGRTLEITLGVTRGVIQVSAPSANSNAGSGSARISIWRVNNSAVTTTSNTQVTLSIPASLPNGRSISTTLPPGDYLAVMFEDVATQQLRDPDSFSRFSSVATRFTVRSGESVSVTPPFVPRDQVERILGK